MTFVTAEAALSTNGKADALFTFAYDDIRSIRYFEEELKSYWNKDGMTITEAITLAYSEYDTLMERCAAFSDRLFLDATRAGGEKYGEICELSYRQAFDRPGTWSMKYNIVWDKLFRTNLMDKIVTATEFASYKHHVNHYGMPLDNRETYTKSDWLIWTATLAERREDFEEYVAPLWEAYNCTLSRVPMTDWFWTVTSNVRGFQHRSVVSGHFIKLLEASGKMKQWKK